PQIVEISKGMGSSILGPENNGEKFREGRSHLIECYALNIVCNVTATTKTVAAATTPMAFRGCSLRPFTNTCALATIHDNRVTAWTARMPNAKRGNHVNTAMPGNPAAKTNSVGTPVGLGSSGKSKKPVATRLRIPSHTQSTLIKVPAMRAKTGLEPGSTSRCLMKNRAR